MNNSIKRISAVVFSFCAASSIFALGIEEKKRTVEMGLKVPVELSNTTIGLADIFKESIEIDLNKFAEDLPEKGFILNVQTKPELKSGLNIANMRWKSNTGVDVYGAIGLSKSFFEFIANGNGDNYDPISFEGSAEVDAFAYTSVTWGSKVAGFDFEITPSLFIPAVHVKPNSLTASIVNGDDGSINAKAVADVDIYSIINIEPFFNKEASQDYMLASIASGIGFDVSGRIQRKIIPGLKGLVYVSCPVIPGTLNHRTNVAYTAQANTKEGKSLTDVIMGAASGSDLSESFEYSFSSESKDVEHNVKYKINRPFQLGAEVIWSPVGKWLNLDGVLGFGVKQPFSEEARFYLDYSAGVNFNLSRVFEATISSSRLKEVYSQSLDFVVNLYAFELDMGVSLSSASFVGCFKAAGVGAYVAMMFGW